MKSNRVKQLLQDGHYTCGSWVSLCSPIGAEVMGLMGFDWLLIDMEHGAGDYQTLLGQLQGIAAAGDTVLVAAGTYEEQVVVTTSLALLGAGPGLTTVQAPLSLPHGVGNFDYRGVICVEEPAVAVTVAGFTVDGLKRHPERDRKSVV